MKGLLSFFQIVFYTIFLVIGGCELDNNKGSLKNQDEVKHISLGILIELPANQGNNIASYSGGAQGVTGIEITVYQTSDLSSAINTVNLQETPANSGNWIGILNDLPLNSSLTFVANATDAQTQVIFIDTVEKTLTESGDNSIVFLLASVGGGAEPDSPRIISATLPSELVVNSNDNTLVFEIEHSNGIGYEVTVIEGGITSLTTGVLISETTLTVLYDAPSFPGKDTITLTIRGSDMVDSISTSFPLNIIDAPVSSDINVLFGPSIMAVHYARSVTSLSIQLETDPTNDLFYSWSGTGDFIDISGDSNPLMISPFNDQKAGTIQSIVSDSNAIQTSIIRTIEAGDFSYSIARPAGNIENRISRVFDVTQTTVNSPITIVASFPYSESSEINGFAYSEHIPGNFLVTTNSITIDDNDVSFYTYESSNSGYIYTGNMTHRWILETPTTFSENNPLTQGSTLEITYQISSTTAGSFTLDDFNWIGYRPSGAVDEIYYFGTDATNDSVLIEITN